MTTASLPVTRRGYVGRHRLERGRTGSDPAGRRQIPTPVGPDYNPLHPATRVALAPHHWADRHLSAAVDERTGLMPRITDTDTAEAALSEVREVAADVQRWIANGCPIDDQTTDAPKDPA